MSHANIVLHKSPDIEMTDWKSADLASFTSGLSATFKNDETNFSTT